MRRLPQHVNRKFDSSMERQIQRRISWIFKNCVHENPGKHNFKLNWKTPGPGRVRFRLVEVRLRSNVAGTLGPSHNGHGGPVAGRAA